VRGVHTDYRPHERCSVRGVEEPPPAAGHQLRRVVVSAHRTGTMLGMVTPAHLHGLRSTYVSQRCRCGPCSAANTSYHRNRQRSLSRPDETWDPFVPARALTERVEDLLNSGWSMRSLASATGVSRSTLQRVLGTGTRVRQSTAAQILKPVTQAAQRLVPTAETRLLLRALRDAGWPAHAVTEACGLTRYPRLRGDLVRFETAQAVRTGSEELGAILYDAKLLRAPKAYKPVADND
jgi:hypothetical protein